LCLTEATAAQDPEGFAEDQKTFGVVRSKTGMEDEITVVLEKRKANVEENFASFLGRFAANPSLLGGQAVQTLETYKPSLAILQALALFAGQLQANSERIQQLQQTATKQLAELAAAREQLKHVLNQLESVTIRLDQFADLLLDLQSSLEGIRKRTDQDTDEKLKGVRDILEGFERNRAQTGLSFPDYEPLFVETLGKPCWSWLGLEVRTIFVSAEGLFRYHGSQPAIYTQDHSPALFQFCRGLELLLNTKL